MLFIAFILVAAISLLAQFFGGPPPSFDLDDPEAARAKAEELYAIEDLEEQGRAWCSLKPWEVRAVATHTEMSNIITTTTHTSSAGETTTNTVVEPAPNQDELVERAVKQTADFCRYNVWANAKRLFSAADDEEQDEVLCQLTPEEAAMLIRFISPGSVDYTEKVVVVRDTGESTETTVSRPPEPVDESGLAAMMQAFAAECGWDGG